MHTNDPSGSDKHPRRDSDDVRWWIAGVGGWGAVKEGKWERAGQ